MLIQVACAILTLSFSGVGLGTVTELNPVRMDRYQLPLDDYRWRFSEKKALSCGLKRRVDGLGDVSFVAQSGLVSLLVLRTARLHQFMGSARVLMKPESWSQDSQELEFQVSRIVPAHAGGEIRLQLAVNPLDMFAAMSRPYWMQVELYDLTKQLRAVLDVPMTGFNFHRTLLTECLTGLLPYNFDQLRNTELRYASQVFELTPRQRTKLTDLANYLKADSSITRVSIDAHADSSGARLGNLRLSGNRADQVYRYLLDQGVPPKLVKHRRHHGARYPAASNATEQGREQNRRVEIKLERAGYSV